MSTTNGHHFRIHVEMIDEIPRTGGAPAPLIFEARNHDDILAIVDRVQAVAGFSKDDTRALVVGLKLFSSVMLAHRHNPLFADVQPAIRAFNGSLKLRVASATSIP